LKRSFDAALDDHLLTYIKYAACPIRQHSVQTHLDFTRATVTDTPATINGKRSIWLRGLVMIFMAVAFHISTTLLALVAIAQFVLALVSDTPNARLIAFGQSLGLYLSQIGDFVSFGTEEVPFPFNAWPQGTRS
jgi:uncharacterized protein DUF4389